MNKILRGVLGGAVSFLALATGWAETITLSDGRVFRDASVVSETARTVTLRFDGGLASVDKLKLPAELQAKHPPRDEPVATAVAANPVPAGAESATPVVARPASSAVAKPSVPAPDAETPATEKDRILGLALPLAQRHFETTYLKPIGQHIESEITLSEAQPVEGWSDRWRVRGTALLRFHRDTPFTAAERESLDPDSLANRNVSARELRRRELRLRYVRTDFVRFEGLVTHLDATPEFELTRSEGTVPTNIGIRE